MCLLQCQCALRLADHDTWDECGTGTKMGGMDGAQDSARCLPALRQAPDPRLPRRRGCFATRSAREIGCLCVSAVNAVSAWCLPARESTCLRASLARDTTSRGEEVVSGAEAASSAGSRKSRAASAARRRRMRNCGMLRKMYLAKSRRWTRRVPSPAKPLCFTPCSPSRACRGARAKDGHGAQVWC